MVEFIDSPIRRKPPGAAGGVSGKPAAPALKHTVNISGYTIIAKIGESGSSTVWKAKQESLNRIVAIKVLKKKNAAESADVEGFISEAKILAKLKSPHTIQIYDIGKLDDTFYLVMEYLDRQTLKELLHEKGALPQKEALNIAAAIVDALDEAWNTGKFYHGDIKPDNIMLEKDGSIKLSNLGLSRMLNTHSISSGGGEIPYYISPEQAHGDTKIDYRSDMYSLGALLYHMVTGQPPFAGKSRQEIMSAHNSEQIPYPCDLNPAVSPGCAQIITRLMMVGSNYRFKEWSSVYRDLTKLSEGKIVVTKISATAISTVAKPGTIKTASTNVRKPVVASKKTGAGKNRVKELKNKYAKKGAPKWLSFPLELAMAAWFVWLGYQLIWLPTHPAENQTENGPYAAETTAVPAETETAVRHHPAVTHVNPEPVKRPSRSHSVEKSSYDKPAVPAPLPEEQDQIAEEDNTPAAMPLPELKQEILKKLLNKKPGEALKLLKDNYPDSAASPEIAEINKIISSGNLNEKAVAAVFVRSIGIKKTILYNGRRRQIVVTGVKGTTVSADVYSQTGSSRTIRPAKFKISQLDPLEQSRWLGDPRNPNIAITKFLLHMSAADYATALKLAERCGPFADACSAEVNAKIKMLME